MSNLKHARFWKYDGTHRSGHDCERYDPHDFGLKTISTLTYLFDYGEPSVEGVSLNGVVVKHHKGDNFGHQVHVAATPEQWAAVTTYCDKIHQIYY